MQQIKSDLISENLSYKQTRSYEMRNLFWGWHKTVAIFLADLTVAFWIVFMTFWIDLGHWSLFDSGMLLHMNVPSCISGIVLIPNLNKKRNTIHAISCASWQMKQKYPIGLFSTTNPVCSPSRDDTSICDLRDPCWFYCPFHKCCIWTPLPSDSVSSALGVASFCAGTGRA